MMNYSEAGNKADILLRSKAIFTCTDVKPFAGSVAIKGNKIQEVIIGEDDQHVIGENTVVKEYGDKLIMPGFVDAHVHLCDGSVTSSKHICNLTDTTSEAEAVAMLKQFYETHPNENRIRAYGWFPATWNDAPLPTKRSLDEALPDIPVYCIAADFHTYWVNSAALDEAGYDKNFQPESGDIGRYEDGELNGLIFEPIACRYASEKFFEFTEKEGEGILKAFFKKVAEVGVTSIGDMSGFYYGNAINQNLEIIKALVNRGEMTCRLHVYDQLEGREEFTETQRRAEKYNNDYIKIAGVKGFVDGVTSTYTALLTEPYKDKPETRGINAPIISQEMMQKSISAANKEGFPVRLHCVGDGAVRMALDMYEQSIKDNGPMPGINNTVEHIENIVPDDIKRFKELDVIPSMQPLHLVADMDEKIKRIGAERCRWEWVHRSLLDSGAKLAFGSDHPVVELNPYPSIYAAVVRKNLDGSKIGVNPEEKITLSESLCAYTIGAANAYRRADELGSLEAGKFADIIVVDRNLFDIDENDIQNAKTDMTMMDGKIVFER